MTLTGANCLDLHFGIVIRHLTDGIADDLRPDKLGKFAKWLREEIARKPRAKRVSTLRQALREWPTPGHLDDKTVADAAWRFPSPAPFAATAAAEQAP